MFDGDKSDGIPGVNGIGKKTLIKLFPFMETEENIRWTTFTEVPKHRKFHCVKRYYNQKIY